MVDVTRDLSRLGMILQLPTAQERLGAVVHIKDFMYYYFSRFLTNLTTSFKEFNGSEIQDFNRRHKEKLAILVKRPNLQMDGVIVPIPKGMVKPYGQTLGVLLKVLGEISPITLKSDIQSIISHMVPGKLKDLTLPQYTKTQFDEAKHDIGKLFGKTGLDHSTAKNVLPRKIDVETVNVKLLDTTSQYYPDVLSLNLLLKSVESTYAKNKWTDQDKVILTQTFMTMAYRLSIFAVIMEHVQDLEHSFTKSLDILLRNAE